MIRFLLDANLSPITAGFLRNLGFDTKSITEDKLGYLTDEEVIEMAKEQKRIVITFDLDFGEIYHGREAGNVGIIVLRLVDQTSKNVNFILKQFFDRNTDKLQQNTKSLVVIKKDNIRFVK